MARYGGEFDASGDGAHPNWPDRFFAKIVDGLLIKTRNNGGRVVKATTYILSGRELFDFALPLMKVVAANPVAAVAGQSAFLDQTCQ